LKAPGLKQTGAFTIYIGLFKPQLTKAALFKPYEGICYRSNRFPRRQHRQGTAESRQGRQGTGTRRFGHIQSEGVELNYGQRSERSGSLNGGLQDATRFLTCRRYPSLEPATPQEMYRINVDGTAAIQEARCEPHFPG
jgi:hypothetical protein